MTSTMGYAGGHSFGDPHQIGGPGAPAGGSKKGPGPSGIADPRSSIDETDYEEKDRYVILTPLWKSIRRHKETSRRSLLARRRQAPSNSILPWGECPLGHALSSQELASHLSFNRNFWREQRQGKTFKEQEAWRQIERRYGNLISAAAQVLQNNQKGVIAIDLTDFSQEVRCQFLSELLAMRLHYLYYPETLAKLPPYDRYKAVVEVGTEPNLWESP